MEDTAKVLMVGVVLRLATSKDFFYLLTTHNETGKLGSEKKRCVGMPYFLMIDDKIESYELHEQSDSKRINEFIKAKKCFVIARMSNIPLPLKYEEVTAPWIDESVKQR